jgi:uncharacterized membrane protein YcjF (UPF0283 family)
MKNEQINEGQLVLANAIDLGSKVIMRVVGDNIGSTLNGEKISTGVIVSTFAARLNAKLMVKERG